MIIIIIIKFKLFFKRYSIRAWLRLTKSSLPALESVLTSLGHFLDCCDFSLKRVSGRFACWIALEFIFVAICLNSFLGRPCFLFKPLFIWTNIWGRVSHSTRMAYSFRAWFLLVCTLTCIQWPGRCERR